MLIPKKMTISSYVIFHLVGMLYGWLVLEMIYRFTPNCWIMEGLLSK